MTFRLLLHDLKKHTENLPKLRPKTFQNPSKIGTCSHRNAVSKTDRRNVSKNLAKAWKWTPKCGPKSGTIFDNRPFLFDLGGPWEPRCLRRPSQEPSGPVRASIFTDFRRIWGYIFTDFGKDLDGFGDCCSVNRSVSQSVITQTTNHSVIHSDQSLLIADCSFFWKNVRTSDQPPLCSLHAIPDV